MQIPCRQGQARSVWRHVKAKHGGDRCLEEKAAAPLPNLQHAPWRVNLGRCGPFTEGLSRGSRIGDPYWVGPQSSIRRNWRWGRRGSEWMRSHMSYTYGTSPHS
eukprot:scaffold53469_cov27-Tisochrysis_lutea.AAC.4